MRGIPGQLRILTADVIEVRRDQEDLQRVVDVEVLPKLDELIVTVRELSRRLDRPTRRTKRRVAK